MRTTWIAGLVSGCVCVSLAGSGRAADPPASYPLPMPTQALPTAEIVPCPPDPCPPVACPAPCPPPCRPVPRVRVIMTPPEIVFQQSGCEEAKGWRKIFPGCAPSKPVCPHEGPTGAPQGAPGQPHVTGQPQGQPGGGQGFQTVPVTTFHAVPVMTFQTVP